VTGGVARERAGAGSTRFVRGCARRSRVICRDGLPYHCARRQSSGVSRFDRAIQAYAAKVAGRAAGRPIRETAGRCRQSFLRAGICAWKTDAAGHLGDLDRGVARMVAPNTAGEACRCEFVVERCAEPASMRVQAATDRRQGLRTTSRWGTAG